MKKRIKEI
jgi:hypothetical protein